MTKSKGNRQSFAAGAAVLTVAAVIVKIIGALYKIPLAGRFVGNADSQASQAKPAKPSAQFRMARSTASPKSITALA